MAPRLLKITLAGLLLTLPQITKVDAQEKYASNYVAEYMKNCSAGLGSQGEAICSCIIRKSEKQYSLKEFQEINRKIDRTGVIPPEFIQISDSCQADPYSN